MDALCNGAKKPEGIDPVVDPRPPPAKLARLEQNGAGPSAQERSRQGSPGAKKPTTARPQSKNWHSRGTGAHMGKLSVDFSSFWKHDITDQSHLCHAL